MADFYKTMFGIFETGKIVQSETDAELSERLRDPYDMEVICSGFYTVKTREGRTQGTLCTLIDGRKSRNNTVKSLENLPGAANNGLYLNSSRYGECLRQFADDLLKEDAGISGSGYTDCDEVVVSVFDFTAVGIGQVYGWGYPEVRRYMNKHYYVGICDIVGIEDSEYIVLVDRMRDYKRIIRNKDKICGNIFAIMKKRDYFDLLEYEKMKVSFLLKESLNYERLSRLIRSRPVE